MSSKAYSDACRAIRANRTCSHIPGASRRITVARERFEQLTESITVHEDLVEAQRSQLDLMNQHMDEREEEEPPAQQEPEYVTDEMLKQEEETIKQLEQRRDEMESKIKNLDRQMSFVYRKNM
jgi:chromosome segregation ATPase